MILVDSSAWIEYLRATGSPTHLHLRRLVTQDEPLGLTEQVVGEVLAGARDAADVERIQRLLYRFGLLPGEGLLLHEEAAALYRSCRRAGETIRSFVDCVIAAVAIRHEVPLLAADRDFTALARHTQLRLLGPRT